MLASAFHRLPVPLQQRLRPAVALLRRHDVTLLQGTEKTSGEPLSIIVAGRRDLKDYILKLAFARGASELPLGRAFGWLRASQIAARAPAADMIFRHVPSDLEWLPRSNVFVRVPTWLRLEINLGDRNSIRRGREKYNRIGNALRRARFGFRRGASPADFAAFYDRMHLPYVRSRHGDGATVERPDEMLRELQSGARELILVTLDGRDVGGGTVSFSRPTARFWHIGILEANAALVESGVADAIYHQVITLSRARGCKVLHIGHSRPFVSDGVFEYKRQFGAHAAAARVESEGSVDITPLRFTPAVTHFLNRNPVVAIQPDGGYCFVGFVNGSAAEASKRIDRWRDQYCFAGTLNMSVLDPAAGVRSYQAATDSRISGDARSEAADDPMHAA
jgi:hypothetical protein